MELHVLNIANGGADVFKDIKEYNIKTDFIEVKNVKVTCKDNIKQIVKDSPSKIKKHVITIETQEGVTYIDSENTDLCVKHNPKEKCSYIIIVKAGTF